MWQLKSLRAATARVARWLSPARAPHAPPVCGLRAAGRERPAAATRELAAGLSRPRLLVWFHFPEQTDVGRGALPAPVADPACLLPLPRLGGPAASQVVQPATSRRQEKRAPRAAPTRQQCSLSAERSDQPNQRPLATGLGTEGPPAGRHRPWEKAAAARYDLDRSRAGEANGGPSSMGAHASFPARTFSAAGLAASGLPFRARSNVRALRPPRTRTLSRAPMTVRGLFFFSFVAIDPEGVGVSRRARVVVALAPAARWTGIGRRHSAARPDRTPPAAGARACMHGCMCMVLRAREGEALRGLAVSATCAQARPAAAAIASMGAHGAPAGRPPSVAASVCRSMALRRHASS